MMDRRMHGRRTGRRMDAWTDGTQHARIQTLIPAGRDLSQVRDASTEATQNLDKFGVECSMRLDVYACPARNHSRPTPKLLHRYLSHTCCHECRHAYRQAHLLLYLIRVPVPAHGLALVDPPDSMRFQAHP